jgi:copper resistance protein D
LQLKLPLLCLPFLIIMAAPYFLARAVQEHHHHEDMSAESMSNTLTAAEDLKVQADKKESEFNHHLAGFFVVLGGAFMALQGLLTNRWPLSRHVWPASFFLSGIFVLVWSDTELWPFGRRQWLEALQNNQEVLQHKVFAVLLLGLGIIEYFRVKGTLSAAWSKLLFPALTVGGSILLLFHQHEGGMHGTNHMEVMARIQSEHLSYATVGMGIGLAKGLAEIKTRGQRVFSALWPLLMVGLGILLMFYRE